MRRTLLCVAVLAASINANSQYNETFEIPAFGVLDSAWFGQDQLTDGDTIYSNGPLNFELNYNSSWQSYTGFAVSSWTDDTTPGFGNQFSAATGGGSLMSDQYGVCYASPWGNNRVFLDDPAANTFWSVIVTNTTYAYQSMLNGDAIGKPFGADTSATGVVDGTNGEDWFLLTIYALGPDSLQTGDSVNFYLADYTGGNTYISQNWEVVDLSTLHTGNEIHGLDFVLTSSDTTGGFGMNTPSYFALDGLNIKSTSGILSSADQRVNVYPNPTSNLITIESDLNSIIQLYDLNGRLVKEEIASSSKTTWNIQDIESGIYQLQIILGNKKSQAKIVKQ
ncbi:MAG: hypothetical protein ACI857_002059 [Arenicella sp.]|jgi:hypothetical protein